MSRVTRTRGSPTSTPFPETRPPRVHPQAHTLAHTHTFPCQDPQQHSAPPRSQGGGGARWGAPRSRGPLKSPGSAPARSKEAPAASAALGAGGRGGSLGKARGLGARAGPPLRGGDEGVKDPVAESGRGSGGRKDSEPGSGPPLSPPDGRTPPLAPSRGRRSRAHTHSTPLPSLAPSPTLLLRPLAPPGTHAPARWSSEPRSPRLAPTCPPAGARHAPPTPSGPARGGGVPRGGRAGCP